MAFDDLEESARAAIAELWTRELQQWWHTFNSLYLRRALTAPLIMVGGGTRTLGQWDAERRVLTVSAQHIETAPWSAVLETLRHEMAHQYVSDVLRVTNEPPHGPAFRLACERLRVDARATGDATKASGDAPQHRIVAVVQKLLALGTSPNRHEAAAAVRKAHALLTQHNIDLLEATQDRSFARRQVGAVRRRHHSWEITLASLVAEFFFVEALWTWSFDAHTCKNGRTLELLGTPANLEMAEYVHSYLSATLEPLWIEYRRRARLNGNRERLRYYDGVLLGFRAKLDDERRGLRDERGLVYAGDPKLRDYFRHVHPQTRTRYSHGSSGSQAKEEGRADGGKLQLRRPLGGAGAGGGLLE